MTDCTRKTYAIDDIIQMGTQIGIRVAQEEMSRLKMEKFQQRHDRRLRNTQLLFKNYRNLKLHFDEATYKSSNESAISILEELDDFSGDNELIIESISKSRERTAIIMRHISKMLSLFRYISDSSKRTGDNLKYRIIEMSYINDEYKSVEEISWDLGIDTRTLHRHKNESLSILSGLIFGVDGIKWSS